MVTARLRTTTSIHAARARISQYPCRRVSGMLLGSAFLLIPVEGVGWSKSVFLQTLCKSSLHALVHYVCVTISLRRALPSDADYLPLNRCRRITHKQAPRFRTHPHGTIGKTCGKPLWFGT